MATRRRGDNGLLESIFEWSDEAIYSETLDGTITSWNPAAERLYRYTAEEAIGQNIRMLAPEDDRSVIDENLRRVARGEKMDHEIVGHKTKDGRILRVSISLSPVRDAEGKINGASVMAHEVTATERRFDEMRGMMAAVVAQAAQTEVMSKRVHDAKNAAAAAVGALELVNESVEKLVTSDDLEARLQSVEETVSEDVEARLGKIEKTVKDDVQTELGKLASRTIKTVVVGVLIAVLIAGSFVYLNRVSGCYARNQINQVLRDIVDHSQTQQSFDLKKLTPDEQRFLGDLTAASPPPRSAGSFNTFVRSRTPIRSNCFLPF